MNRRRVLAALAAAGLFLLVAAPAAAGFDDVGNGHWARPYIEVLDDEGVVDAYHVRVARWLWWEEERRFYPAEHARRDAWFTFLARLFGLEPAPYRGTFADVPADHRLASGEPATAWLEAAARAGVVAGGWLHPAAAIERQAAVASLLRALGLQPFAAALPPSEVERLLARFRDAGSSDPALRPLLAAAIRLRVLEGYPDGTLRPAAWLTRAEAAAVLARSALVRPVATPNPFSPDGDGRDDQLRVGIATLRTRRVASWSLRILHAQGGIAWQSGERAGRPDPHDALRWDGRSAAGVPLPAGTYYLQGWIRDARGLEWESGWIPVGLLRHRLDAVVEPGRVRPGGQLTLTAWTEPDAIEVRAQGPGTWGGPVPLQPVGWSGIARRWQALIAVPVSAPAGPADLEVIARFPAAERRAGLRYTVAPAIELEARVDPDPAPAGVTLHVHARTSADVIAVRAVFADGLAVDLARSGDGGWQGSRRIPADAVPGESWVDVTARGASATRTVRVPFRIGPSPLAGVRPVLSD